MAALRVALITPRYAPAIGGIERHVEALARGLTRRGVTTEVVTTDPTGRLPALEEQGGVLIRRFRTLADDSTYYLSAGLGQWLARHAGRFDILHAHSYHTPLALQAALASWWRGVPLVFTPHYHGTGHSTFRRLLHLPYRLFGAAIVRRSGALICVSETERALLRRHFRVGVPIAVIPNGADVDEIQAAPPRPRPSGRPLVLTVARLERYKQTDRLIGALPLLPPTYEAAVIGEGPARAELERLAARLRVGTRLSLLGGLERQVLLGWYRSADVFVSLSRKEAFGLTLLEAAAAGAAVVASAIPAHREVAGYLGPERALLLPLEASSEQVAQAVTRAVQLGRRPGGADLKLPSWDAVSEGALAVYQTLVSGRSSLRRTARLEEKRS